MRDPAGDIPWEEDSTANSVVHLSDEVVSSIYSFAYFNVGITDFHFILNCLENIEYIINVFLLVP